MISFYTVYDLNLRNNDLHLFLLPVLTFNSFYTFNPCFLSIAPSTGKSFVISSFSDESIDESIPDKFYWDLLTKIVKKFMYKFIFKKKKEIDGSF